MPDSGSVKEDYNPLPALFLASLGETGRLEIAYVERQSEFLLDFTDKCERRKFALFDLASGEFPQSAMMLSLRTAMHEYASIGSHQSGGDHQHPCRIIFQLDGHRKPFVRILLRNRKLSDRIGRGNGNMKKLFKAILGDASGATAVEYGLIVSLIVIAIITSVRSVADETNGLWATVSQAVTAVMGA